ncbi:MAG: DUF721 domain-containing protein [Crocinitomicaceae bacterium]
MRRKTKEESEGIGDAINRLLKAYHLDGKMKEMDVLASWGEMMGKAVAMRTTQLSIKNKVLHISLDSSVMRDELANGKQIIIERINQKAGKGYIVDVWFS